MYYELEKASQEFRRQLKITIVGALACAHVDNLYIFDKSNSDFRNNLGIR